MASSPFAFVAIPVRLAPAADAAASPSSSPWWVQEEPGSPWWVRESDVDMSTTATPAEYAPLAGVVVGAVLTGLVYAVVSTFLLSGRRR